MGKIRKLIKGIEWLVKKPSLINNVINDEIVWSRYLEQKYKMTGLPVVSLNDLIPDFRAELNCFAFLDGGSLPTDIALLNKLADRIDHCKYFEIGTWRGESVANVAKHADECYTLNLPDQEMRELGLPEKYIQLHAFFSKELKNVRHLKANSKDFDYGGLKKKFDLIFIDGDHHYEYVKNDTKNVFEHLVHDESIIVWHDYAKNPEKIRHEVMAGILDGLPGAEHKNLYHIGNTLSAIYTRQTLPSTQLEAPLEPRHCFEVKLILKNL